MDVAAERIDEIGQASKTPERDMPLQPQVRADKLDRRVKTRGWFCFLGEGRVALPIHAADSRPTSRDSAWSNRPRFARHRSASDAGSPGSVKRNVAPLPGTAGSRTRSPPIDCISARE